MYRIELFQVRQLQFPQEHQWVQGNTHTLKSYMCIYYQTGKDTQKVILVGGV